MMRKQGTRLCIIFLLATMIWSPGCGPEEQGEEYLRPDRALGKADAVTLVSGASIKSSYVSPSLYYLSNRSIRSLVEVGAMSEELASVAWRVDGIIASQPANNYISIAELERMEEPTYFNTLFPAEQAAFGTLWQLMELPAGAPTPISAPLIEDLRAKDISKRPSALSFPSVEPIDSLPAKLQTAARRLQLAFDSDGDPETISFADLDQGLNDSLGRFTPGDLQQFQEIRKAFYLRGTSTAAALLSVSEPGVKQVPLDPVGDLRLQINMDTQIDETRDIAPYEYSGYWSNSLTLSRKTTITVDLPPELRALLINEADGAETILEPGQELAALVSGSYFVEFWKDGVRIANQRAVLPALESDNKKLSLWQFIDYDLVTFGGTPLTRNTISAKMNYSSAVGVPVRAWATFKHELTAHPPLPGQVDAKARTAADKSSISLPAGTYELEAPGIGTFYVEIYPQGVMMTIHDGHRRRMRPQQLDHSKQLDSSFADGLPRVVFNPQNNELWTHRVDGTATDLQVTLSPLDRI